MSNTGLEDGKMYKLMKNNVNNIIGMRRKQETLLICGSGFFPSQAVLNAANIQAAKGSEGKSTA